MHVPPSVQSMCWFVFLKTKYWNKIGKKNSHRRGGGMFDNGNVNWCMLGRAFFVSNRAFLCRTGLFCVEPCILLSNRAFLSRTSVIIVHAMQARVVDSHIFLPAQNTIDNTEDCHSLTEISPQIPSFIGGCEDTRTYTYTHKHTHVCIYNSSGGYYKICCHTTSKQVMCDWVDKRQ